MLQGNHKGHWVTKCPNWIVPTWAHPPNSFQVWGNLLVAFLALSMFKCPKSHWPERKRSPKPKRPGATKLFLRGVGIGILQMVNLFNPHTYPDFYIGSFLRRQRGTHVQKQHSSEKWLALAITNLFVVNGIGLWREHGKTSRTHSTAQH